MFIYTASVTIQTVSRCLTEAQILTPNKLQWEKKILFKSRKPSEGQGTRVGTLLLMDRWVKREEKEGRSVNRHAAYIQMDEFRKNQSYN